jgi:hypothetical protein
METRSGRPVFKFQTAVNLDVTVARVSNFTLRQLYQMVQGNIQGDATHLYLNGGTLIEARTSQILKRTVNHSNTADSLILRLFNTVVLAVLLIDLHRQVTI